MAVMTVGTAADVVDAADGVLSLREAVAQANATPEADTIRFAEGISFTIAANSAASPAALEVLAAGGRLTIEGDRDNDGQADVALGGGFAHRFTVHVGAELVLVGIDITGANGQAAGAAAKGSNGARGAPGSVAPGPAPISHFSVDVNGNDLLEDAEKARIRAYFGQDGADAAPAGAGGDGQAGAAGETRAGAILNRGTLTLVRVGFSDNRAVAGLGGQGGRGGNGGFAVAGGSGIEGHQLESPGRPVSMPLSQYEVEPYWMWVGPGDAGQGGQGGAGGAGGQGGAGGRGGHAAGAIVNEAGATLSLTDVAFGGRLLSGLMGAGNRATGGHGGTGGAGGDGSAGMGGGQGGDDGWTANRTSVKKEEEGDTLYRLQSGWHLYSGAAGTGGEGGSGGHGGNAGANGQGGSAAGAVLNLGTVTGAAAVTAQNIAAAGLGAAPATVPAPGGAGGPGGSGGLGGRNYPDTLLLPTGTAVWADPPHPSLPPPGPGATIFPDRPRIAGGAAGADGLAGVAGTAGLPGEATPGVLSLAGASGAVQQGGALVFLHPLWTGALAEGGVLAFNVIRIGDAGSTLTVGWALEGVGGRPAEAADVVAGHPLSGTVTLSQVATGTAVERDGSPASPAQTSVRRVEIPLAADGLAEAAERMRVILTDVASSAPGVSAVLGTKEAGATVADGDASVAVSRGGVGLSEKPSIYSGPVDYVDYEFLGTEAAENAVGTAFNDFINLLGGVDAADGGGGDDVIDGGTGSNFLTGGPGRDVFFLDGRGGQVSWSTITDWEAGEQLSVWGWQPGVSKALWLDSDGTPGFTGVTMHGDLDGNGTIDTSVTWSGRARADLPEPLAFDGLLWFT